MARTRTVKTEQEFNQIIDIYNSNGFKVKKQTDTEAVLVKKTKGKRWKTFNNFFLIIPKLTIICCTIFTAPLIYNWLHTKREKCVVKLEK